MESKILELLKDLPNQIKTALSKPAEVKLGSIGLADGSVTIEYDGETLEPGTAIWVTAEDGTKVAVPIGEHPLEDGTILIVTQEGIVEEIKAAAEPEAEPATGAPVDASGDEKIANEIGAAIKSVLVKYTEMETKMAAMEASNEKLTAEVLLLSKEPATKPIKSTPSQVDLSKMTGLEKHRYLKTLV